MAKSGPGNRKRGGGEGHLAVEEFAAEQVNGKDQQASHDHRYGKAGRFEIAKQQAETADQHGIQRGIVGGRRESPAGHEILGDGDVADAVGGDHLVEVQEIESYAEPGQRQKKQGKEVGS